MVNWGYHGQHTPDAVKDISVNDVRWLLRYLGRIRDGQIKQALIASGATSLETECFTVALRRRINELERWRDHGDRAQDCTGGDGGAH